MEITTEDEQEEEVEGEEKEKENKTKPFPSLSIWTHAIGKRNLPSQIESSRVELSLAANRGEIQSQATPLAILLTCFCSVLISIIYMQMLNRMIDPQKRQYSGGGRGGESRGRRRHCHCEMCREVSKFDLTGVFPSVKLAAIRRSMPACIEGGGWLWRGGVITIIIIIVRC